MRPRAAEDFDVFVQARRLQAAIEGLRREFGPLTARAMGPAVRLEEIALDRIRSDTHPLFRQGIERALERHGVRVPPAELRAALNYLAAIGPWREPADRKQDAADLMRLCAAGGLRFDRAAATGYAAAAFPGAEREFAALLQRLDRGEPVRL
ncbi:MAG: hypothetical protein KatS3mg102_1578 [Planctomycetota bacterium]|nr:MAG: hypothetical protein KatS3mg102_1578 [Planctomycetota bacterium]